MPARHVVLLTPAKSSGLLQLPSRQHPAPVTPFRINTYRMPISVDSKEPTEHLTPVKSTLMKTPGERLSDLSREVCGRWNAASLPRPLASRRDLAQRHRARGRPGPFVSYVARFGVEPNQKFMGQGNTDDFLGLSRGAQTLAQNYRFAACAGAGLAGRLPRWGGGGNIL